MSIDQKNTIPARQDVADADRWDLSKLFTDDQAWRKGLDEFNSRIPEIASFKGTLGTSVSALHACLDYLTQLETLGERLGYYAQLRYSEDAGDSKNQERVSLFMQAASAATTARSFVDPEIQGIDTETLKAFLKDPLLEDYQVYLSKLIRMKPHILSEAEERLLGMQMEANQTAQKAFSSLTDVDFDFGTIETPEGAKPLSQSSLSSFLMNPDRSLRETAYRQFYRVYDAHKNTIATLYAGSVHLDTYQARARNFKSSRAAALFPDNVPEDVYDNLISTVSDHLPTLHRYYGLRKKLLGLDRYQMFDNYVPLISDVKATHSYTEAVELISEALMPLGSEYVDTLRNGLLGGWVDKYENKGKRSGAFSAGSFVGDPYILMNYKEDVLRDVFTLAHEGGHSMHSWYSSRNNPFPQYDYTIFEAEVASTFNEQLLLKYLLERADDERMRAYLINKHIDDILATLFRQTMFAEFEHRAHHMNESGTPLTVDSLRSTYKELLEKYFGPDVTIDTESDLEGLRIPHFYRAYYVYKYATGISAAISLSKRVLDGGTHERDEYFNFLKSGGSRFPIDALNVAGVDMSTPQPISEAMMVFDERITELERLTGNGL
ncbi:MAG: oligoendopeptidase F [Spirochaetaceae bacterium]|nr:MAG: oligoendopeptidase F [Spirochaetaceae bacterium]